MGSSATEIAGLYSYEDCIEKPSDGMSAYITYTSCILFRKLKTIAKTSTLNYQGCSGMLGGDHTPSYAEAGGVVWSRNK